MTLSRLFVGKKVRLTALSMGDIVTITRWYQDSEFMRMYDASPARPRTESAMRKWLEEQQADKDTFLFGIRLHERDELIGVVDIGSISWGHGNAWLGIAIGTMTHQGKGYGYEAMRLALDFAFDELNLHRVQLTVFSYNERAIRLYERLGFTREGAHREFLMRDGQRYDMILFGILRHEWWAHRANLAE